MLYAVRCVCVYIHIFFSVYRRWSDKRNKKVWTAWNAACKKKISACHFGHACHRLFSLVLRPFGLHKNNFTFNSWLSNCLVLWYKLYKKRSLWQMLGKTASCTEEGSRQLPVVLWQLRRITRRLERRRDPRDHFTAVGRSIAESG